MTTLFFEYLLPFNIAIVVFYVGYYLLLRKGSFFQLNRYFLLFALIFSLALPFIHFENAAPIQQITYTAISQPVINAIPATISTVTENQEVSFDWDAFLKAIYIIGIAFMFARLLAQFGRISYLIAKFGIKKENGCSIVLMQNDLPHFSFFRFIFINQKKMNGNEESSIIAHEKAHIKQCHFIDLLLLEVATALQWYNPLMWFYKRSLKSTHEYLADQAVLKTGAEKVEYCQLLVKQTTGFHLENLTNSFYYPSLKNRIMMMTKKQNNRKNMIRLCFTLPLFILLISVFSYAENTKPFNINEEEYKTTPDQPAVYKNGEKDLVSYFISTFGNDWEPIIVDKTAVQLAISIDETGKVVSVATQWSYFHSNKEIDFQRWFGKMGAWKPAIKNGKPIKSTYIFDGTNALMEEAKRRGFRIYTVEEYEKKSKEDEERSMKENPFNTTPDQPAICKGGEKTIIESFLSGVDFDRWKSIINDETTMSFRLAIDEKGKVVGVGSVYNNGIALIANTNDEFDFDKRFEKMNNWKPAMKDGKPIKSVYIFEGADILRAELKKRGLKIYTREEHDKENAKDR